MTPRNHRWARDDYTADAPTLAQRLIGAALVRTLGGQRLSGRIVETEAYSGVMDQASHAAGGRRTARNEAMYARAGTAYVYLTYGMHHCFNVVCGDLGEPAAALIRAVEPLEGAEVMASRRSLTATGRQRKQPLTAVDLASGPGRLCQAMGIDRGLNGQDMVGSDQVWIEWLDGAGGTALRLENRPRVGVERAGEWAGRLLRWYDAESTHVSVR